MMADRSVTGAAWQNAASDARIAAGLIEATGMPQALANILASRGLTRDDAETWLDPKIRHLMPDPSQLSDMDAAADRLARAVIAGERVGVFGDYDVDGACSAALFERVLKLLGVPVSVHIPDRFNEGYGPNAPALLKLSEQGCGLIITVDCGITAHRPIAAAVEAGVDVIIVDHHIPGPDLPKVAAVVNPNRLDDGSLGYLAAAGVCFLVLVALLRQLRGLGFFTAERVQPDLMAELDVVALATIADVVPLKGLNRAFVRTGLAVMAKRERPGLAALADVARLEAAPDVHALGFILGPRINAGGRIGESRLGVELLVAPDHATARPIAEQLDTLNSRRREIDQRVADEAILSLEGQPLPTFVMATGKDWHQGVIGIAASRVKDHFQRPAAVISLAPDADGEVVGKASARSIAPFKLGEAVIAAVQHGLLIAGGGHDMAAGFTIAPDQLDAFGDFMNQRAEAAFGAEGPVVERRVDSRLAAGHCTLDLLAWMERAGPWGTGFPEPCFLLEGVRIEGLRAIGKDHSHRAFRISDATGSVDGVAFRVAGTDLGQALDAEGDGRPVDLLGRLSLNRFNGRERPQFIVIDLASAGMAQ